MIFLLGNVKLAYAHVLQTDGSIGAVMHTDPDDDPIAGKQTGIFFAFKDKKGKFIPKNCDCKFSIIENDKTIYFQPLFQNNPSPSLDNASVIFIFPKKDKYVIQVTGKSNTPNSFQPFKLVYEVRVEKEGKNNIVPKQSNVNAPMLLSIIAISLAGGYLIVRRQTS